MEDFPMRDGQAIFFRVFVSQAFGEDKSINRETEPGKFTLAEPLGFLPEEGVQMVVFSLLNVVSEMDWRAPEGWEPYPLVLLAKEEVTESYWCLRYELLRVVDVQTARNRLEKAGRKWRIFL
jgi:hypothetical protein